MSESLIEKHIENAAGEYRRAAGRLLEIAEAVQNSAGKAMLQEDQAIGIHSCIERMRSQSRQLEQLSHNLAEIARNRHAADNSLDHSIFIPEYETYGGEFGESRFGNLEEHDDLIPIHRQ